MVASDEEVTVAKGKEKVEETSKVKVATEEERGTSTYAAAAAPTGVELREQPVDNSLTSNLAALIAELREARVDAACYYGRAQGGETFAATCQFCCSRRMRVARPPSHPLR